jgi:hypothetical protein
MAESEDDLYTRQRRLPEVGAAGQERLAAARLEVRGSDGAIIEAEYLHRAGVERLAILPGAQPEPFVHEGAFRFFASRRVAAGAWRALRKIRRELGMERE